MAAQNGPPPRDSTERRINALMALQDISRTLISELDLKRLLQKIIHAAVEVLDASTGSLLIWDPSENSLVFAVTEGGEGERETLELRRMPADQGIAGWIFTHRQPVIVEDVSQDERFFKGIDESLGRRTSSLVGVPLMTKGEMVGVIEVLNKRSGEKFDEQDLDTLSALAGQAAIAIVNARLYLQIREERDRMLNIEEEVHKKLARDFHDGPAQILASLIMDIEFIQKLLERDPSKVEAELLQLREKATKAMRQARTTMFELRPLALETKGLKAALEYYVQRLRQTENMSIYLQIEGLEERLPQRVEDIVFAIVLEALGNIKKHARANNVWLTVICGEKELLTTIQDDGRGFDVEEVEISYATRGSIGLLNLYERAEMLGGRISIESAPGQGTTVSLMVPIPSISHDLTALQ
jgi:signal transduction histidine kinase